MNDRSNPDIETFNNVVSDCESYLFASRDINLQREASQRIELEMSRLATIKANAQSAQDEDYANLLLGCQCVAGSIHDELNMWIALKSGEADRAWDYLIGAQNGFTNAVKAHDGFAHNVRQVSRLEALEQLLFPKPIFVSAGFIVGFQECSICGKEYGECDHIAGKPYLGKFCAIIARKLSGNHVAIVPNPADKGCRVIQAPVESGQRNWMSWVITPDDEGKASTPNELTARLARSR